MAPAQSVQPTNTHPSPLEQSHFDGAGLFLWGGLSSLRPSFVGQVAIVGQAFQLGLVPFTDCRSCAQSPRRRKVEQAARLAMPAVTPAEPQNPELCGSSNAIRPAGLRAPPQAPAPLLSPPPSPPWFVFLRVLRVLCGLPSPCPPHPQSQPSPNLFPFPFQPLAISPFLLLVLPSCMLKVKGAADALVGARTADGASPGQRRRRPQPLPSPDGGELRSLKPAAGGEQAGGGLLT